MRKIIVIPDSFKGSMSSEEVASIISEEIEAASGGKINIESLPIADGGEGSTDCILKSLGGEKVMVCVKSPENKDIEAFYGVIEKSKGDTDGDSGVIEGNGTRTAVIEIAQSSGITRQTSFNAKAATTYGFGQLIKDALDKGCRDFLLCLGGSATTDCGLGMAAALGAIFKDENGESFVPVGGTLSAVKDIDISHMDKRIGESSFTVMCDVDNPLYGENGAAYVYGPQKGASPEDVVIMDEGLRSVSELFCSITGTDIALKKGAGAAGGAGYGCMAFLNATMKSGIEAMLETVDFDSKVTDCDLIVTGEGKIDEQSFMGKVLSGIIRHSQGKKISAFCGCCGLNVDEADESADGDGLDIREYKGIDIVEIGSGIEPEESIRNGRIYLRRAAKLFFERIIKD